MIFQKNNKKRKISRFMILVMVLSAIGSIFPSGFQIDYAYGESVTDAVYGDEALPLEVTEPQDVPIDTDAAKITSVEMKINGEVVDENTEHPIEQNSNVSLFYTWEIDNFASINEGDYIEVDVPIGFRIATDVFGPLSLDDGGSVGTFFVDRKTRILKLTFNDFATNLLDVKGTVQLNTRFELQEVERENPVEFTFPLVGESDKIIKLKFKPEGIFSPIEKGGKVNKEVNPDSIIWTVDINKTLEKVEDVVLEDTLGEGLSLVEDSLKIYKLNVDLDGNVSVGEELASVPTFNLIQTDPNTIFTVDLGYITDAYRLVYETKIEDKKLQEFKNTASFSGGSSQAFVTVKRGALLEKKGTLDKTFNPEEITWTIYINMSESDLTNAKVKDTLPDGLSLKENSIKVYELTLNSDGTTETETDITDTNRIIDNINSFTVDLGTTNKAHKIEYLTTITDKQKTEFKNLAELFEMEEKIDYAEAKVDKFTRGYLLYKYGYSTINYNDKYIEWIIDVNTGEESITNAIVTDTIGEGLTLNNDTINVYSVTFKPDGNIDKYTLLEPQPQITIEDNKFIVNLGNIDGAYRITYRTQITDVNKVEFTNNVDLDGDGIHKSETATNKPTIINDVSKQSTGINYFDKTINWRITIKPTKEAMKNLIIEDTFPNGGLVMLPDSIVVKKGVENLEKNIDYTVDYMVKDDWTKGFKITFIKDVEGDNYIISYKTLFDRNLHTNLSNPKEYKNEANFSWKEETDPEQIKKDKVSTSRKISEEAFNNGSKSGILRRTDREIDWTININYLSETFTDLVVEDEIVGNQGLDIDSVKVYRYTLKENGNIIQGAEVEESLYTIEELNNRKLKIRFNGEINSPYRIVYTTKLMSQSQDKYNNTANVGGTELDASVNFSESEEFIDKKGLQNDLNVDWEIRLNTSLSTIKEATLIDTLSEGHEYIENSFKVYKLPEKVIVNPNEYDLDIKTLNLVTGEQAFELKFKEIITSEYLIEYKTEITAEKNGTEISNEVKLTGLGVTIENQTSKDIIIVEITDGSGTGQGTRGKLKIQKVDGDNPEIKLEGAVFQLLDNNGDVIRESLPTDEDGYTVIDRLSFRTYFLKEIKSPEGYQPSQDDVKEIVIDSKTEKVVTVENTKIPPQPISGGLSIKKIDSKNSTLVLSGAKFEVKDSNGEVVAVLITDEKGVDTVTGLSLGKYTIVETKAPRGYKLDKTIHEITISSSSIVNLVLENTKTPTTPGEGEDPEQPEDDEDTKEPREPKDPKQPKNSGDSQDPEGPKDSENPAEPETLEVEENTPRETPLEELDDDEIPLGTIPPIAADTETDKLPQTGEGSPLKAYIFGLLLIGSGGIMMRRKSGDQGR